MIQCRSKTCSIDRNYIGKTQQQQYWTVSYNAKDCILYSLSVGCCTNVGRSSSSNSTTSKSRNDKKIQPLLHKDNNNNTNNDSKHQPQNSEWDYYNLLPYVYEGPHPSNLPNHHSDRSTGEKFLRIFPTFCLAFPFYATPYDDRQKYRADDMSGSFSQLPASFPPAFTMASICGIATISSTNDGMHDTNQANIDSNSSKATMIHIHQSVTWYTDLPAPLPAATATVTLFLTSHLVSAESKSIGTFVTTETCIYYHPPNKIQIFHSNDQKLTSLVAKMRSTILVIDKEPRHPLQTLSPNSDRPNASQPSHTSQPPHPSLPTAALEASITTSSTKQCSVGNGIISNCGDPKTEVQQRSDVSTDTIATDPFLMEDVTIINDEDYYIQPNTALLYRMASGDTNAIHVVGATTTSLIDSGASNKNKTDNKVHYERNPTTKHSVALSQQQWQRPKAIVHGSWTFGVVARYILQYCHSINHDNSSYRNNISQNPTTSPDITVSFRFMEAQFAQPIYIHDTIKIRITRRMILPSLQSPSSSSFDAAIAPTTKVLHDCYSHTKTATKTCTPVTTIISTASTRTTSLSFHFTVWKKPSPHSDERDDICVVKNGQCTVDVVVHASSPLTGMNDINGSNRTSFNNSNSHTCNHQQKIRHNTLEHEGNEQRCDLISSSFSRL